MQLQRGKAKALADDEVGAGERVVDVAVVERAVGDARIGLDRGLGVEHRLERLVLDVDQLERVLGEVAVARDNDGDRLAHVARRLVRPPRSTGSAQSIPAGNGRESSATSAPVSTPTTPGSSSAAAGSSRVMRACANGERSDGGVARVRDRVEVVDEAALAAQQRFVLEAGKRAADPAVLHGRRAHAGKPTSGRRLVDASELRPSCERSGRHPVGERIGE